MNLNAALVALGILAFLLAILGIAGLLGTTLTLEIILMVVGVALVLFGGSRGARFR